MKANNTTKRIKTLEEINAQAERLMQANETWYQDAKRVNREPINRKAQIVAAWHNTKIAAKELQTTPETMKATYYKVTAINSGVYSLHTDKHVAEAELNNLIQNGKPAKLETVTDTPTETEKEETETLNAIIACPLDYLKANDITGDAKFRYMLLDRMQQDCEYYLRAGRCARQLWAGDEEKQIKLMVALWMAAPEPPEWLTFDQIGDFAKQMKVAI